MNVFISYRRKDAQYIAGSIYYWLEHEFGPDHLFKDVDTIPPGRDFRRILQDAVTRCDVLLVVIGPRWLGETDVAGRRRVDDPEDWVRIEIETALERSIPVIPLLVDEASFPRGEDLPPSLQGLVYRNGIPVRPDPDFRHDMGADQGPAEIRTETSKLVDHASWNLDCSSRDYDCSDRPICDALSSGGVPTCAACLYDVTEL